MIILEDLSKEPLAPSQVPSVLGIGLVSLAKNRYKIVFNKGITHSLMNELVKIYGPEILIMKEGKIIDHIRNYTVYIQFYTVRDEKISIFYLNEKNWSGDYDTLCSFSKLLIKTYCTKTSRSKINQICNEVIPRIKEVSAFLVINTTGQTLFTKIRNDKTRLLENHIQIGGFLSAVLMFSNEVIGKTSGESLHAINFENHQFLITVKEEIIFAYLVEQSETSDIIERYMELLIEEFFNLYREHLEDFDCDLNPFNTFEAVVDKYFLI